MIPSLIGWPGFPDVKGHLPLWNPLESSEKSQNSALKIAPLPSRFLEILRRGVYALRCGEVCDSTAVIKRQLMEDNERLGNQKEHFILEIMT